MTKSCRSKRVCVLMLNSPNISIYAHFSAVINYSYSTHHGYDFVVARCPRTQDMEYDWMWDTGNEYTFVWSKPALVKRYLPFCDHLLFLDSDAVVVDMEKSVHMFLIDNDVSEDESDDAACIVISQDCVVSTDKSCVAAQKSQDQKKVNTGVMLFKRNPMTFRLLDEWIAAPRTRICSKFARVHTREQACLDALIAERPWFEKSIRILNAPKMNGRDGTFVRHLMAVEPEERSRMIGDMMCKSFLVRQACDASNNFEHFSSSRDTERRSCSIALLLLLLLFLSSRVLT